mgnify:FL=1
MRNLKKLALFALMGILLFSCTSKSESESNEKGFRGTLKPSSTTISGDLGEYFKVVDEPAYVDYDNIFGPIVTVKIEKIDELLNWMEKFRPVGYFGSGVMGNYGFGIKIFDEKGNQIITENPSESCYSSDDLITVWQEGVGENNVVRWSIEELDGKSGEYTFTITSYMEENTSSGISSSDNDSSTDISSSSDYSYAEIQALLDEMESLVNRLATLEEFSSEYDLVEEQIQQITDKLDDANMAYDQESRYDRLDDRFWDL